MAGPFISKFARPVQRCGTVESEYNQLPGTTTTKNQRPLMQEDPSFLLVKSNHYPPRARGSLDFDWSPLSCVGGSSYFSHGSK
jgi:hypothetical protein